MAMFTNLVRRFLRMPEGSGGSAAFPVDDREDVGGINFCRMDARVVAPLPHILASFFARRPYRRKAGHYPNWNGFYLLLYRHMEEGWKLLRIRRDFPDAQFAPVLAVRSKVLEE